MKIAVIGIGNIGSTLINMLSHFQKDLNITEIHAIKHCLNSWQKADIAFLEKKGIKATVTKEIKEYLIENHIDFIFDCGASKLANQRKEIYNAIPSLIGAVAQGSEKDFGIPYLLDVNNKAIFGQKYTQVVSCNTHGALSVIKTFSGGNYNTIKSADFVCVRRSEDIGNHSKLVNGTVVARHLDDILGTHHAIDVHDTLKTIGVTIPMTSSDITTPSTIMHSLRFSLKKDSDWSQDEINNLLVSSSYVSSTAKFDSNKIFDLGRRYGFQGRIFSHSIIVESNLLINGNTLQGWAFIPQEGNSILSTISAFLHQTKNIKTEDIIKNIWMEIGNKEF